MAWKNDYLDGPAEWVAMPGFNGIGLPGRDGFQVRSDNFDTALNQTAMALSRKNVKIASVAENIAGTGKCLLPSVSGLLLAGESF
jgi:hypothetical protein